ncbi:MAG: tRNA (adenosine(37)-N6)-threonylcarbamoyltransferase complex dimerization subunit type 1 TsaB [Phycisphaerae bacterium]|nr:tRNA (adenosine(37)-N6)-threonylcarbamoyltransferase complex dimerization subunit type 1 TsaB [Phycisphaerae bacterium]
MAGSTLQPRIVAIETTGRQGSVAVALGDEMLEMIKFSADLRHAAELLPTVRRLCEHVGWRAVDIEEVYVSAGPGSFTGCRIGVTVARTLALAVGVRLVSVPTVDAIARNALALDEIPEHLAVVLDAQRRQIYAAICRRQGDGYRRDGHIRTGSPSSVLSDVPRPCAALGEGIAYHRKAIEDLSLDVLPETIWAAQADQVLQIGRGLAKLGRFTDPTQLEPIYIRLPEAEERWRQRHGRAKA